MKSSKLMIKKLILSCTEPQCFSQAELSNLVRDSNFSKESSKVVAFPLKENNLLESGTLITYYRNWNAEFSPFFKQTTELVYCSDLEQVTFLLGVGQYSANSKQSLNCFFLQNTNEYEYIPIWTFHNIESKEPANKEDNRGDQLCSS